MMKGLHGRTLLSRDQSASLGAKAMLGLHAHGHELGIALRYCGLDGQSDAVRQQKRVEANSGNGRRSELPVEKRAGTAWLGNPLHPQDRAGNASTDGKNHVVYVFDRCDKVAFNVGTRMPPITVIDLHSERNTRGDGHGLGRYWEDSEKRRSDRSAAKHT